MATPGVNDGPNMQGHVIAASVVMLVLSATAVGLRLYTRKFVLGILGADDCFILAALILSVGVTISQIRQTLFALGRHAWQVSEDDMTRYRLEEWYGFLLYATSLSCSKISILLLYRRFLCLGWARICWHIVLGTVVACSVWVFITSFIDCIPLAAVWDKTIQGKCIGLKVKVGNSYAHIITDFIIFFLPIPFVVSLKLGRRKKIGLMLVFGVGFVACFISIIRIVTLSTMDFVDFIYKMATLAVWGAVEVNLAIICACLTTLKPLIAKAFPSLLESSYVATSGNLEYIGRHTGTTVNATQGNGTQVRRESPSFVKLDNARSNDSDECEMDDLERQVRGGVYMASPPKAYSRLP